MYAYTDDDLNRIDRAYLGPKKRRLPWVATYRTYGVSGAVIGATAFTYYVIGLPINIWWLMLAAFVDALLINAIVSRMKRDVSVLAMIQAAAQEVSVPRAPAPRSDVHVLELAIPRYSYESDAAGPATKRKPRRPAKTATCGQTPTTRRAARKARTR